MSNDRIDQAAYEVGVHRRFTARHYLTVPEAGPESDPHAHAYRVELTFSGPSLDGADYLVDIDAVQSYLDQIESRYAGALLNDLPEFHEANPSVERFARCIANRIAGENIASTVTALTVTVWEDEDAYARYHRLLEESPR